MQPGGVSLDGAPAVHLDLAVDKPVAFLVVRLNEAEPNGASTRITYGVLNLIQLGSRAIMSYAIGYYPRLRRQ